MTTNRLFTSSKFIGVMLLTMLCVLPANAQFLRTSYFMEGTHYRQQLNPALVPTRGYFNIPVLGSVNATVSSTSLGYQDIIDIFDNDNEFYKNPKFLNSLKDKNNLNVNLSTEILSAGWYKGENFWSVNVGFRADVGAKLTKSLFEFLNEMDQLDNNWSNNRYDIRNEQLNVNSFFEVGLGYAREINNRLTVGGKVKVLLGAGNLELKINKAYMNANLPSNTRITELENMVIENMGQVEELRKEIVNYKAELMVDATLESSFKGLTLEKDQNDPNGYINDFDFEPKNMGVSGYGMGIDLGVSYKIFDNLTVSASILDLGFITWSKSGTKLATATGDIDMKGQTYADRLGQATSVPEAQNIIDNFSSDANHYLNRVGGGDVLDYDLLQLTEQEVTKSRNSHLASTFVVGAEYGFFDNQLGVGVLSTTRLLQPKTLTEITVSANYRPKSWFNIALSYSAIQAAGKSFGLGLKLGPVFLGTDYMFLGKNSNSVNGFIGVSVPLGGKKSNKQEYNNISL